ncbi:MAG: hypothetical protein KZQ66_21195 [Candidatus Thiodiazotropha sp. (ex Lucinoma aequizonata)]|nr:hypothetical protein [Candidatus Thiodiazotropha sp. (ex Lucinoma aequizonata)]MCU7896895.1 hypothetical protein [Candidatus Thiodiazotropha sp. (ex Lucinoma aequizonata)]MCU7900317.1 hypothetical protein [Candidatus Thiodiazotropha sp. (ex Lucinoma aequizonata)]MCU7904179.1 hypothetical protein [Candidatus Thiodiazotropha sp. (ex Lucinoma aequizonata)]MCU7910434.1 hypothetical protein [Candidatus Thiodiazotropha sp. (ex Lucinoma aequizonata)]
MSKRLGQMDSDIFNGNIVAIELALESRAEIYIPGHGMTGGREVPEIYLDYLSSLKAEVAKHFEEGLSDFEMSPLIVETFSRFSDWVDFKRNVGQHISLAYLEVEAEFF